MVEGKGGWLGILLGKDQLSGSSDAQDVFLPFMEQDDLSGPLHEVSSIDPFPLGSWSL